VQLDKLGAEHGVRAFAVHPGGIMTDLQRHLPREEMIASGRVTEDGTVNERFKSPEQGAATSTWAATSPMLAGRGGVHCEDGDIAEVTAPDRPDARVSGVNPHAVDPDVPEGRPGAVFPEDLVPLVAEVAGDGARYFHAARRIGIGAVEDSPARHGGNPLDQRRGVPGGGGCGRCPRPGAPERRQVAGPAPV
jgi:hypothetical protein